MNIYTSLLGGVMIGIAAVGLLRTHGKIAGISGIAKGLFSSLTKADRMWRYLFLFGVILGGYVIIIIFPELSAKNTAVSLWQAILGGALVGIGSAVGNGCTSGHGVCGLGRKSKRSFFAVIVFLLSGFLTMYILTHIIHIPRL